MSFGNVGRVWTTASFPAYLGTQKRPAWAKTVTVHHCAAPSLAQRPAGLSIVNIESIRDFYRTKYGWNRGPHFFTDEDQIFGMTPPTVAGIHAVSFNGSSIGFEMLGNYDTEDPWSGRGLQVAETTAAGVRAVLDWLGLEPSNRTVLFHRFDPRTTKTCPGTKVSHDRFLALVIAAKPGAPLPPLEIHEPGEMVPLVAYVAEKTRRPVSDLVKLLRTEKGLTYLGEQWIEGAIYDKASETTIAPRSEADEAVDALNAARKDGGKLPVVATMADRLGITYADAAKRLRFEDGFFKWDGKLIVGAVYDRATQTTVAPADSFAALFS